MLLQFRIAYKTYNLGMKFRGYEVHFIQEMFIFSLLPSLIDVDLNGANKKHTHECFMNIDDTNLMSHGTGNTGIGHLYRGLTPSCPILKMIRLFTYN